MAPTKKWTKFLQIYRNCELVVWLQQSPSIPATKRNMVFIFHDAEVRNSYGEMMMGIAVDHVSAAGEQIFAGNQIEWSRMNGKEGESETKRNGHMNWHLWQRTEQMLSAHKCHVHSTERILFISLLSRSPSLAQDLCDFSLGIRISKWIKSICYWIVRIARALSYYF